MSIPVYPADLPTPMQDGYSIGAVDPLSRTEMEDGSPYARRKTLTLWTPVSLKVVMTAEEANTLYGFWRFTLNAGSARFTMPIHTLRAEEPEVCICIWQEGSPTMQRMQDSEETLVSFQVKARFS